MENNIELLSPVGDFECLKAAVQNGADSVYFGASNFNARTSATNFDLTELKIRYLELSVKAFEAKNRLFKDEMDRLFKNRVLELEDKKIEISQKDIMNEIEILAKQIDDNNVQ